MLAARLPTKPAKSYDADGAGICGEILRYCRDRSTKGSCEKDFRYAYVLEGNREEPLTSAVERSNHHGAPRRFPFGTLGAPLRKRKSLVGFVDDDDGDDD
jgi:hypothetical protein